MQKALTVCIIASIVYVSFNTAVIAQTLQLIPPGEKGEKIRLFPNKPPPNPFIFPEPDPTLTPISLTEGIPIEFGIGDK